jgi:hypothetical protein
MYHLPVEISRMTAINFPMAVYILPTCALLVPGRTGASTPEKWHTCFGQGPEPDKD